MSPRKALGLTGATETLLDGALKGLSGTFFLPDRGTFPARIPGFDGYSGFQGENLAFGTPGIGGWGRSNPIPRFAPGPMEASLRPHPTPVPEECGSDNPSRFNMLGINSQPVYAHIWGMGNSASQRTGACFLLHGRVAHPDFNPVESANPHAT